MELAKQYEPMNIYNCFPIWSMLSPVMGIGPSAAATASNRVFKGERSEGTIPTINAGGQGQNIVAEVRLGLEFASRRGRATSQCKQALNQNRQLSTGQNVPLLRKSWI